MDPRKLIDLAAKVAQAGTGFNNIYVGAVIANKNRIISVGSNCGKTHPLQKFYGGEKRQCLHAEMVAIISALKTEKDLKFATLYISRVRQSDAKMSMAKPCEVCQLAIKKSGLKRIVYTNWQGNIETIRL